jgi:hypothetical protein
MYSQIRLIWLLLGECEKHSDLWYNIDKMDSELQDKIDLLINLYGTKTKTEIELRDKINELEKEVVQLNARIDKWKFSHEESEYKGMAWMEKYNKMKEKYDKLCYDLKLR